MCPVQELCYSPYSPYESIDKSSTSAFVLPGRGLRDSVAWGLLPPGRMNDPLTMLDHSLKKKKCPMMFFPIRCSLLGDATTDALLLPIRFKEKIPLCGGISQEGAADWE